MLKSILSFVAFILCATLFAQHTGYSLRNYTAIDGLPQSQVNAIVEDANGYLWMATSGGGLARFDGQQFKVFTTLDGLLSNTIFDLKIDAHQNLWIVHPRGITKYDGVHFRKFQAPGQLSNLKMVRRAYVFNDTILIASAPGVLGKLYNDSVYYWNKEIFPGAYINRVHPAPDGSLCLILSDGRMMLRTRSGDIQFGTIPPEHKLSSIYNREGSVIISLYSYQKNLVNSYALNLANQTLVPDDAVFDQQVLLFDEQTKSYWLRGASTLHMKKANSVKIDTILKDTEVMQVFPDREGNYWFATSGNGLYKYYHEDFSKCSSDNMKGVMSLFKDSHQATWIGTMSKGLWKIKNGKFTSYTQKEISRNMVNCITETPDGTVWVGTGAGLAKYDDKEDSFSWYTTADGLSGWGVVCISPDENNNLWIGTSNGLNFFDGEKFTHYTMEDGLPTNMINSSYYDKKSKTLYIGNEFGVNTFSGGIIQQLPIKGFDNTSILSIHPYQDSLLLMGSGGAGFALYNPRTAETNFITTRDGLYSDFIYFISPDKDGYIWVGTEKGISRLRLNSKYEIVKNIHYDHDNGLTGVETNQNAFLMSNGDKYFGLVDGLYQYNIPDSTIGHSFGLHLTAIDIFYGEESSRAYADSLFGLYKLPYQPVFPSDKNHITFSFNRVDKRYPKSVRYKYFLKNFDKAWSQPSASQEVTYSNIPPGEYEFQLMATDNQGAWSNVIVRYPFTVKAPFYQTAGFITAVVLGLILLTIFIFYWRVRQRVERTLLMERIREQEQESLRKEIARDFHDEMGNQLTRIINYVSLLRLNGSVSTNGNGTSKIDLYTKVEDSAKYLYTGTRDFIWSIDPVNDELSKLFIHIRDFGEKLFEEKGIQFRAFNEVKGKIRLPYGFSREANLIFKEAMTNTFKSSQAKNASFSLQPASGGYQFVFEDDGIGFHVTEIENSNGLKNIRARADKLGAILRIHSKPGEGTSITLQFKLTKTKQRYGTTI